MHDMGFVEIKNANCIDVLRLVLVVHTVLIVASCHKNHHPATMTDVTEHALLSKSKSKSMKPTLSTEYANF